VVSVTDPYGRILGFLDRSRYFSIKNISANRCTFILSKLSTTNKLLLYKTILKPIWTYGIQLWGTASTSNIEILERFQSKVLRIIVDAPWYVPNSLIRRDRHFTFTRTVQV
jgi:hypothetical protein